MTLCLLVYAALEYRIREALKQHTQTCPNPKGQPIRTPTARWGFQGFTGSPLLAIAQGPVLVLNMNLLQKDPLIRLLMFSSQQI